MKKVLLEGALVIAIGALFAFGANALSPRGLKLNWNYFPQSHPAETLAVGSQQSTNTAPLSQDDELAAQLKAEGLQSIRGEQVLELFHEPGYQQGQIVFIDARNDEHYQQGHIPGAWQFDNYHPDNYLATVAPICAKAEKVVVYCTGGKCEDSRFAALTLSAAVPKDKLYIYAGGITDWTDHGWPIETGERGSGKSK
jgi:rhodanese-related sulfurtransferase